MLVYRSRYKQLSGSSYGDVASISVKYFNQLKKHTKRRPYIRSAYFSKDKVFLDRFWGHLWEKNWKDRTRRLRLLHCGIDLVQNSKQHPITKESPSNQAVLFHRFFGITKDSVLFFVQIKEDKRSGQKVLMSIFPKN